MSVLYWVVPDPWIVEQAKSRPKTVTTAAGLMVAVGVSGVVATLVFVVGAFGIVRRFRDTAEGLSLEQVEIDRVVNHIWSTITVAGVTMVVLAALLIGLAMGILRGSQAARVITWVVSGPSLLCCSFAFLRDFSSTRDLSTSDTAYRVGVEAYPDWWLPLYALHLSIQVFGQAVFILLLALPTSHPFFRRTPPADSLPYPDPKSIDWSRTTRS